MRLSVSSCTRGLELGDPARRERLGDQPPQPGVVGRVDVEQMRHEVRAALARDAHLALAVRGLAVMRRVLAQPRVGERLPGVGVAGDQPRLDAAGQFGPVYGRVLTQPGVRGVRVGGELPAEERGQAGWGSSGTPRRYGQAPES